MKKQILLACAIACAAGASAQMNVWENGNLSAQYNVENVDSVTFGITSETPVSGTGKDGTTPLLKIENDYWFVSYDNGETWQQEGLARGEKGEKGEQGDKGEKGDKGDKGDSMFLSVTQDKNNVCLTLADGTIINIPRNKTSDSIVNVKLVDLGLPSGTKWADKNLCVDFDTIYGEYFYYGGILPSTISSDTILINGNEIQNGDSIAGTSFDAATYFLGSGWHIPTANEFSELFQNCDISVRYVQMTDGTISEGLQFKSKINGKSILFPFDDVPTPRRSNYAATYKWSGTYWTSSYISCVCFSMERYYHYYEAGYSEMIDRIFSSGTKNTKAMIRPVYK